MAGFASGLRDISVDRAMRFFWQDKILFEKTFEGTTVQVIQRDDRRELCFGNYIIQSAISVSNPDILQLDYTRAMMAGFLFAPQAANILHLGLGAGSLARFIDRQFPQARQILVELNPNVIEAAHKHFFFSTSPRMEVVQDDGAKFLRACGTHFDIIFQDAFHADGVSHHLESVDFFHNVRDHLAQGGWLVNNVWGSDRANLNLVRESLIGVFQQLYALPVRAESNVIFFAGGSESAAAPQTAQKNVHALSHDTGIDFLRLAQNIKTIRAGRIEATGILG